MRASNPQTPPPSKPKRRLSRRRRMAFALVAFALGLLIAIVIAEIALRVHVARRRWTPNCYVTGLAFFVPDPSSGQTLRPGLRLRSSAYDVSVNQLGFRGPEIEVAAKDDTTRIAVLGGSSVFGYLVPEGFDSCRLLEADLIKLGYETEIINAGVPGFNIRQCLARFKDQVEPLHPNIVLLYLGWNDSPLLIGQKARDPSQIQAPSLMQRTLIRSVLYGFLRFRLFPEATPRFAPPIDSTATTHRDGVEQFDENLDRLIMTVKQTGATVVVCTQLMAGSAECKGLDSFMGTTDQQIFANQELGRQITSRVEAAAKRNDVKLIQIANCVPCNQQTLGDAIHLTAKGHRLVADCWRDQLLPLLESDQTHATETSQ